MDINTLKTNKNAKKFQDGHVIFNESDKGDEMYVILEGHVNVFKKYKAPGEHKLACLGPGNFFGEMTMFLNKERTATAVAQGNTVLLAVARKSALEFIQTMPIFAASIMKTLCQRLNDANIELGRANIPGGLAAKNVQESLFEPAASAVPAPAPATPPPATPSAGLIGDEPPPGFVMPSGPIGDTPPSGSAALSSIPGDLFHEGHQIYTLEAPPHPMELVYKKTYKCPVCDASFQGYAIRTTRLKLEHRDKDFRSHYQNIDTTYYETVTCTECWFTNFDTEYTKPIIMRFKENIPQITAYKAQLGIDLTEDRSINPVFAGYYLALKGAPLFYKNPEMTIAKVWLRLKWLYHDVQDQNMEDLAAKKAHSAYLAAFEKTDASPEAVQQLCVLMGELSLIVKDIPNAKMFFVKARSNRGGSKVLLDQAEDGIERIRRIEAGQLKL